MNDNNILNEENEFDIAIIGLAGRFPGAKNVEEFWQNLAAGVESITFFSDEELRESGVDPASLADPNYVKAAPVLEGPGLFDASFFGYSPREAQTMDPQHRLFLECSWEALEQAGYDAQRYAGPIGVFGGSAMNTYLLNSGLLPQFTKDYFPTLLGSDNSFLTTRVSYKLNLTGPSVTVQTACSTSLVAIHMACQSLLNEECDMALAGGVSVRVPHKAGHLYQEGSLFSPDGHVRTFDARAAGTIFGSGVGVIVLKRLEEALKDGDHIEAVIKGTAINNDGSSKVDYTAPSVNSQAAVIVEAMASGGITADTIGYIEAHGTGTALGDPIEVAALTKAFGADTDRKGYCAIGSVKTNIGHLDAAAGVSGLIKTVLSLKHGQIPPSLHFEEANPQIDFESTPFYVNTELSRWKAGDHPRRAGISSLGVGGTNAHVVLEEAPTSIEEQGIASKQGREWQLLLLSAKTKTALETAGQNLAEQLRQRPEQNMNDVAHTLQVGRQQFDHRRMMVCQGAEDGVRALETGQSGRVLSSHQEPAKREVVFMFPGQGSQYVNMGLDLYRTEAVFKEEVDRCSELLRSHLGLDIREILYPEQETEEAAEQLKHTIITQPVLFVIEYALARLWMSWGIEPSILVGHSIGEYVAACLAGVFGLEDALYLVAVRGRLMQELAGGSMLAVTLSAAEMEPYLEENISIAAINGPRLCVVSGGTEAVEELAKQLSKEEIAYQPLHTSHAFHSAMVDPILEPFTNYVKQVKLNPARIPMVSTVSGSWVGAEELRDPSYWARNLRQTVRFSESVVELMKEPGRVLLEVGPGQTLSMLVRQHGAEAAEVMATMRHPKEKQSDEAFILTTLGRLWLAGLEVDWSGYYAGETRRRVPLPTYPFERQRYWSRSEEPAYALGSLSKKSDRADWFYIPSWKRSAPASIPSSPSDQATQNANWLVFANQSDLAAHLIQRLEILGRDVTVVQPGRQFTKRQANSFLINPQQPADYGSLLKELINLDKLPGKIVHMWSITPDNQDETGIDRFETSQAVGFYSLLYLAQAISNQNISDPLQIEVVSNQIQDVTGDETLCPEKATVLGPCRVISKEYLNLRCRSHDVVLPVSGTVQERKLIDQLLAEFAGEAINPEVAYRGNHRWVPAFEAVHLNEARSRVDGGRDAGHNRLREGGIYLITGGLGGLGLALAEYLAKSVRAKLILTRRSDFPEREAWEQWLAGHDEQDDISRKIRKVKELELLGAEVLTCRADVADQAQMEAVINLAVARFGPIQGVIHAAGTVNDGIIQLKTAAAAAAVLAPKVKGTLILNELLKDVELDFLVLFSSINSILAPAGQVDYSAANAFLDLFAHHNSSRNDTHTVSINWPGWRDVGLLAEMTATGDLKVWRDKALKQGVSPDEGLVAFSRILERDLPQVIVSPEDFQVQFVRAQAGAEPHPLQEIERTAPSTAHDAPRNEIEQTVADIWQERLGIEQIDIHENFFELGGNSLLATQICSRLRRVFQIELPVRALFDAPTIAELAQSLDEAGQTGADDDNEKIAQALQAIEQLTADEIKTFFSSSGS